MIVQRSGEERQTPANIREKGVLENGLHLLPFLIPEPGAFLAHIFIDGEIVYGSPLHIVSEAAADLELIKSSGSASTDTDVDLLADVAAMDDSASMDAELHCLEHGLALQYDADSRTSETLCDIERMDHRGIKGFFWI